jgi:outer membrane protein assembly factor BamB/tetratricopeptide (TPR) repeat protein
MRLRRCENWVVPAATMAFCAIATSLSAQQRRVVVLPDFAPPATVAPRDVATSMPAGALPLVRSDPEMEDWIARARAAVERGEYAEAIKILQALIDKPDAGFVPTGPGSRRFVPLRDAALRMLGTIPAEGLERYRRLYDPKARRKLQDAVKAGDLRGIKTVADQYRFTRVGPEAIEAMGQWYFDRARFAQAARTWKQLLANPADDRAALWLLKTTVAYHLAGDEKTARTLAKELREKFPDARATLAGREQNLTAALKTYLTITPPIPTTTRLLKDTYPGWGGLPTGRAVLSDTRAVLQPYWRYPAERDRQGLQVNPGIPGTVDLSGGLVFLRIRQGNDRHMLPLPPKLRPVVADGLVIYRNEDRVIALDARTGRIGADRGWESQSLPMERTLHKRPVHGARRVVMLHSRDTQNPLDSLFDRGRYSLTVGGGRVYSLCHFPITSVQMYYAPVGGGGGNVRVTPSGSSLAALSLRGQGRLDWIVGWAGKSTGGDAFLNECTFLSPPTYVSLPTRPEEGKLYATVLKGESFTLVCLDAATGRLIFKSQIAQTPVVNGARYNPALFTWVDTPMSPPAVAEDRVFVSTNAGVTAAFDAQTGQPIWAYQYGNEAANPDVIIRGRYRSINQSKRWGVNPMIVSDGVVIAMPTDADEVMGFSAADGTLLWRRARNHHLAFVDAGRICLAGKGVSVLRISDGKELWQNGAMECAADPLTTTNSLLLIEKGYLWRISLDDYAVSNQRLQADGLLGNLLSVDGKLIAANALGLCAYYDYDQTYASLSEKMKNATVARRIDLLQQRAELSFATARYEQVLKDYTAAGELAETLPGGVEKQFLQAGLRQHRYRTFIALGNREKDTGKALAWFQQAKALARTRQQQGHMLIRIARVYERGGRFAEAVETARALYEQFPEEKLYNVDISSTVNPRRLFRQDEPTRAGTVWAYQFIRRLIQIHGRDVYAKFDAQAARALQQARRENTPEAYLAISKRWPLSQYADDAMFAAAEAYYTLAKTAEDPARADEELRRCEEQLTDLACRKDNPRYPSVLVALMMIHTNTGQDTKVRNLRTELDALPVDTPIAFADIHGPLEKVLRNLDKKAASATTSVTESSKMYIRPPLKRIFTLEGNENVLGRILYDQNFQPVRLGSVVLVQREDQTLLVDTASSSGRSVLRGVVLTQTPKRYWPNVFTGLSKDKKTVVVANDWTVSAFGVDASRRWTRKWRDFDRRINAQRVVGIGEDLVVACTQHGIVTALRVNDGKVAWEAKINTGHVSRSRNRWHRPEMFPGRWLTGPLQADASYHAHPVSWPIIGGGWVAFLYQGGREMSVFSARSGKLLYHARNENPGSLCARIISDGQLATLSNRVLSIHSPANPAETVWTHKVIGMDEPFLLGCTSSWMAVGSSVGTSDVRVYRFRSLDTPPVLCTVKNSAWKKNDHMLVEVPVVVAGDDKNIYILYQSKKLSPEAPSLKPGDLDSVYLRKFDLRTGEELWTYKPKPNFPKREYAWRPILVGERHLVLSLKNSNRRCPGQYVIVDKDTGKLVQAIPYGRKQTPNQRMLYMGHMAMTQGRLCVETLEGVAVYGSR